MRRYGAVLFLSAALLFGLQPLMGRYALPWFGGAPAMWTACLLFFQAALLLGYGYAHLLQRRAPNEQARLHVVLLAAALVYVAARALFGAGSPIAPSEALRPTGDGWLTLRVLGMLAGAIGLPFVVLSATAPLLQVWFAAEHPGRSPYRLYAISNAGSFLSLLAQPFLLEPVLTRSAQGWIWSAGFLGFAIGCAAIARRVRRLAPAIPPADEPSGEARTGSEREGGTLGWIVRSFFGAVLLAATTQQLSNEVTAGPFLWVLPLGLYLLTFVLCFEREGLYRRRLAIALWVASILGVWWVVTSRETVALWLQLLAYGSVVFTGCLICHGELYRSRPAPARLSAFFLWISAGGVLGTLFVAVIAPVVFTRFHEFPIALLGASLIAAAGVVRDRRAGEARRPWLPLVAVGGVVLVIGSAFFAAHQPRVWTARNFFGALQIDEWNRGEPEHLYVLRHGRTIHGLQFVQEPARSQPGAYFSTDSGLGRAVRAWRALHERPLRLGVLGLGVGTAAALTEPGDAVRFYEIDPAVISLARGEGGFFDFLARSKGTVEISEGDARRSLELESGERPRFGVLAVDVFSGDAIPVHLLTREAMELFLQHLEPDGVLAIHISNRYVDLRPVVVAHAEAMGLAVARVSLMHERLGVYESDWMVLTRDRALLEHPLLTGAEHLERFSPGLGKRVEWTDERASLLPVLR